MLFSDEDLIAYLLDDASDELSQRLQQRLPIDNDLLQRLSSLRLLLGQINATNCIFEPPADLVDTTLQRIDQSRMPDATDSAAQTGADDPTDADFALQGIAANHRRWPVQPSGRSELNTSPASLITPFGRTGLRSLWDSTALTVSLTLLSCLALPALVRVRFESRKAQCARNLELTGSELISYALNHPQGRFPYVALDGPQAFAGVYAIYLREAGGQVPSSQLHCPSLIGCDTSTSLTPATTQSTAKNAPIAPAVANIASFSELHSLAVDELQLAQQAVGGDYAYNLGVSERGKPRAPKYEGRSQFAILADAPAWLTTILQSANLQPGPSQPNTERLDHFVAHEGKGINIFYEDGHVQFVSVASLRSMIQSDADTPDNPFQNQLGAHELGLHPYDASLAPSNFSPLSY